MFVDIRGSTVMEAAVAIPAPSVLRGPEVLVARIYWGHAG
jgi:hypothetical protein